MTTRATDQTTLGEATGEHPRAGDRLARVPALALVWSRAEPERVGEVLCLPRGVHDVPFTIGRAGEPGDDGALPLVLQQLRPASRVVTGPLRDARVSRWLLRVRALADDRLLVERIGRGALRVHGATVERAIVNPGELVELVDLFTLLYTHRPAEWPRHADAAPEFAFAGPDAFGIVGESPAAWRLRSELALVARHGEHVLLHGPSGTGKELAARALHGASARSGRPLLARNAATLAGPLVDVELFGNVQDYPTPGMPERAGLLGEADGGSLLLDFVDELPPALQARLLRVMDGGEYQRPGEARPRTVDLRLIGTTCREPEELRPDLRARFIHRIRMPGLSERAEDIPLLARHLAHRIAVPELRARLFAGDQPRLSAALIAGLVRHEFTGHVRELHGLLWRALTDSRGDEIDAPPDLAPPPSEPDAPVPAGELTRERVLAALAACGGVREQTWRALGLRNRDQLKRLLKKFAIA